ncbi:MAG: hypothetical protein E7643_02025 [Ruminococcaceae bacterium]|nr:hypothetical protein [Oscillospiraceae bacterium]
MYAKTVVRDGFVKIEVNGEILEPAAFMTYRPDARIFEDFRRAGIRFTSFGAYAPDHGINDFSGLFPMTKHFWVGEDRYDFSQIDHDLELICPKGNEMYVFPRVFLDVPTWWEKKYPEERCMDDKGVLLRQSFASQKWREDASRALCALMDHIEASKWRDCVVGYHVAAGGTEEWTPECYEGHIFRLDYSEVNRQGFSKWLEKKYESVVKWNLAWGSAYSAFSEVRIPSVLQRCYSLRGALRDGTREKNVIDFYAYTNDVFADSIVHFCRTVKEHSNGSRLAGAFYGYNIFLIHPDKGHFALSRVLGSPYVDFIAATGNHPEPGGAWSSNATLSSAALHGKLFFCEGDIRTHLTRTLGEMLPHVVSKNNYYKTPVWTPLASKALTFSAVKKAIARVLTEGVAVWWFDMFGGAFDDPDVMGLFSDFCVRMKERRNAPLCRDVAFVVDETGVFHMRRNDSPAEYINKRQVDEISRMGAPVDMLEAKDLLSDSFDADKYRLIILSGFLSPSEDIRRVIDEKLRGNGRTLLWCQFTPDDLTGVGTVYDPYSAKAQGVFENEYFPTEAVSCPRFVRNALDGAYSLAAFADDHTPSVLAFEREGFREIVSVLPCLPSALLREIATLAGVHVYTRKGDVIYAGGNYVAIHACTAGEKRICLPCPVRALTDTETGEHPFLFNGIYTDIEMKEFETRIYKIEE